MLRSQRGEIGENVRVVEPETTPNHYLSDQKYCFFFGGVACHIFFRDAESVTLVITLLLPCASLPFKGFLLRTVARNSGSPPDTSVGLVPLLLVVHFAYTIHDFLPGLGTCVVADRP